jgi:hypothetical protein
LRLIGSIHRGIQDKIITVTQISSSENLSNHMSKLPSSALKHALGLEGIIGKSKEMDEYEALVVAKFAKKRDPIVTPSTIPQNSLAFAAMPTWTNSTSANVIQLLKIKGLSAAQHNHSEENFHHLLVNKKTVSGLGFHPISEQEESSFTLPSLSYKDQPLFHNFVKSTLTNLQEYESFQDSHIDLQEECNIQGISQIGTNFQLSTFSQEVPLNSKGVSNFQVLDQFSAAASTTTTFPSLPPSSISIRDYSVEYQKLQLSFPILSPYILKKRTLGIF